MGFGYGLDIPRLHNLFVQSYHVQYMSRIHLIFLNAIIFSSMPACGTKCDLSVYYTHRRFRVMSCDVLVGGYLTNYPTAKGSLTSP